ncbi:MAG TPA: hypothetical protein VGK93_12170 [Candidatus Eisenbacteria bacterium]|jgi:hypothetical protein
MDEPRIGKAARLWVNVGGHYDTTAVSAVRLRLPAGIRLVSGDTLFRGHPRGRDNAWTLVIRAETPRRHEIRGSVSIQSGPIVDEGDYVLAFEATADTAIVERSRPVRCETVRGGRRYRYAGEFLIPIERTEEFTQTDIEHLGQRATGPRELDVACASCRGTLPQTIRMVAFVGADGKVVEARARVTPLRFGDDLVAGAKQAISGAKYRPARVKGRAVADWVLVDVHVSPAR